MESGATQIENYTVKSNTGKRRIAQNTLLNFFSRAILIPIGLISLPAIVNGMGSERFGLFSLTWVLLSYFTILDLGFSQAITKFIATEINQKRDQSIPHIFWTATLVLALFGLVISILIFLATPWIVNDVLHTPQLLTDEAVRMFQILGLAVPFIFVSNAFRGAIEAKQRFDLVNAVRTPYSASIYLLPLVGYLVGWKIDRLTALLFLSVLLAFFSYIIMSTKVYPNLFHELKIKTGLIRSMFGYSGWIAISNFVAPLLLYLDRFLITATLTLSVLAFYTAPYEALTRLWFIPLSITATLFPAFSGSHLYENQSDTLLIFSSSMKYLFLILGPITILIFLFSREIMQYWIGPEFAANSNTVTKILILGIFLNSLGRLQATLFYGRGRPDIPAKLHLIELPFYVVMLIILLRIWGINGAALAWTIRVGLDTLLLFIYSNHLNAISIKRLFNKRLIIACFTLIGLLFIGVIIRTVGKDVNIIFHLIALLSAMVAVGFIFWFIVFEDYEKSYLVEFVNNIYSVKHFIVNKSG